MHQFDCDYSAYENVDYEYSAHEKIDYDLHKSDYNYTGLHLGTVAIVDTSHS